MMRQHVLVQHTDKLELQGERWRRGLLAGREIMREVSRKPGPALRAAPDHHGVRTGERQRLGRVREVGYVAVHDHRNADRLLHGAHCGPVRLPLVELAARAAMHGDQLHAGFFGAARKLRRVA